MTISPNEYHALLKHLRSPADVVARLQFFTFSCGEEVTSLRGEDLLLERDPPTIRFKGRNNKIRPRTVEISPQLANYLRDLQNKGLPAQNRVNEPLITRLPKKGPCFPDMKAKSYGNAVREAREKIGKDSRITTHSLKRSGITVARQAGYSRAAVRNRSGHTSDEVLDLYVEAAPTGGIAEALQQWSDSNANRPARFDDSTPKDAKDFWFQCIVIVLLVAILGAAVAILLERDRNMVLQNRLWRG